MVSQHTVEKIGGTSMSRFDELLNTILVGERKGEDLYGRIFVVSAYSGITNALLEHKKTGEAGVYGAFANGARSDAWINKLEDCKALMLEENLKIFVDNESLRVSADAFLIQRISFVRSALISLQELTSFGHFSLQEHLPKVREMLASIGEAHSAFNSTLRLKEQGVNAQFVDLTGWNDSDSAVNLDDLLTHIFSSINLETTLPIVTGYAHCKEGLMTTFDRGYSEMTFSRIACVTSAKEAIIHKEFHLSSADPRIVGIERVYAIGKTNYDVADQLSNLGMEAIHPKAAAGLRKSGINLRIKNAFEPQHPGTLITLDYRSPTPCVEMVAGRENLAGIEIFDQEMLGSSHHDLDINKLLHELRLTVVSRDSTANSTTYFVDGSRKMVSRAVRLISERYPDAEVTLHNLSIVSAVGSDLKVAGILAQTVQALATSGINIQAIHQSVRQVEMQCFVRPADYEKAIRALHESLIESQGYVGTIAAA